MSTEDRCRKHQPCLHAKDFITTFAVQLMSYREKLREGSKRKTIKDRCGKGEMAVWANSCGKLAGDSLGLKQEFLCVSSAAQQSLGTTADSWRQKDRGTSLEVAQSCPRIAPWCLTKALQCAQLAQQLARPPCCCHSSLVIHSLENRATTSSPGVFSKGVPGTPRKARWSIEALCHGQSDSTLSL